MRFPSSDPRFAILKLADGRPIKVDADEAGHLPGGVDEFNEVLFDLLRAAFANHDRVALDRLWGAAHRHIRSSFTSGPDEVEHGGLREASAS